MTETRLGERPIVILACQVFQHWLENLLPADRPPISFFDYGLHAVPKNLRRSLQATINAIEQPSLIVLGFGLCGNGLSEISAGEHYLLIPRTDDCNAILLGSYKAYRREIEREPGTYYLSKGWLEAGTNPLQESRRLEAKYGAEKAAWLMDVQYQHYRRLAMVARDADELQQYRERAEEVAAYCGRWGMRYEELTGSDGYLRRLLELCGHDSPQLGEDFLLVPPGGKLEQGMFMRNA